MAFLVVVTSVLLWQEELLKMALPFAEPEPEPVPAKGKK